MKNLKKINYIKIISISFVFLLSCSKGQKSNVLSDEMEAKITNSALQVGGIDAKKVIQLINEEDYNDESFKEDILEVALAEDTLSLSNLITEENRNIYEKFYTALKRELTLSDVETISKDMQDRIKSVITKLTLETGSGEKINKSNFAEIFINNLNENTIKDDTFIMDISNINLELSFIFEGVNNLDKKSKRDFYRALREEFLPKFMLILEKTIEDKKLLQKLKIYIHENNIDYNTLYKKYNTNELLTYKDSVFYNFDKSSKNQNCKKYHEKIKDYMKLYHNRYISRDKINKICKYFYKNKYIIPQIIDIIYNYRKPYYYSLKKMTPILYEKYKALSLIVRKDVINKGLKKYGNILLYTDYADIK